MFNINIYQKIMYHEFKIVGMHNGRVHEKLKLEWMLMNFTSIKNVATCSLH